MESQAARQLSFPGIIEVRAEPLKKNDSESSGQQDAREVSPILLSWILKRAGVHSLLRLRLRLTKLIAGDFEYIDTLKTSFKSPKEIT